MPDQIITFPSLFESPVNLPAWSERLWRLFINVRRIFSYKPFHAGKLQASSSTTTALNYVKIMKQIPKCKRVVVIEKLSKRYELPEYVTSKILLATDDDEMGISSFEDEKFYVEIRIREAEFNLCIRCSQLKIEKNCIA